MNPEPSEATRGSTPFWASRDGACQAPLCRIAANTALVGPSSWSHTASTSPLAFRASNTRAALPARSATEACATAPSVVPS
jgi:hypothetical protein